MSLIGLMRGQAVAIHNGIIVQVADEKDVLDDHRLQSTTQILDVGGRLVTPGLIDAHTHFIFAGQRADEFEEKIRGVSYLEIAARGGGIKRTVRDTTATSANDLIKLGRQRLDRYLEMGVTTVEVKSGYGLSLEHELRMLKIAQTLNEIHPVDVVSTLLAAHEIPEKMSKEEYLRLVVDTIIPRVAELNLADFCDVFCERGVFSIEESELILNKGLEYGLVPKIHADQIHNTGASRLGVKVGAVSVDHADHIDQAGIQQLAESNTVAVLLPGCNFFMGLDSRAPARSMIDQGVAVALATDFNPGSCMTQNIQLIMTMGCVQFRMTPAEVLTAVTTNAAHAIGRAHDRGRIQCGFQADMTVFDVNDIRELVYHFGALHTWKTIKHGLVCWERTQ